MPSLVWLQDQWPGLGIRRLHPLGSHGGLSGARFWRVESLGGVWMLRRWPQEGPTTEQLLWIHRVIAHVFSEGLRLVPVPAANGAGETCVSYGGYLWQLEPWLPGEANYHVAPSVLKLQSAMRTLARFHQHSGRFRGGTLQRQIARSPAMVDRLTRLQRIASEKDDWSVLVRQSTFPPAITASLRTLATYLNDALPRGLARVEALVEKQYPLQVVIRDIWHGNILFEGDHVSGIVDFGSMSVDTPAVDVARLLGSMAGDDPRLWETGLESYREIRPLDELESVHAFDTSGTVVAAANWLRWLLVENRRFGDFETAYQRLATLGDRLKRVADRI